MPKRKENPVTRQKAVTKYRRKRTIVKKILELAKMRNLKINMIVYDEKHHKLEEIYTHDDIRLDAVGKLTGELTAATPTTTSKAKKKQLKFESRDAMISFKFDNKFLMNMQHDQDAESSDSDTVSDDYMP